MSDLEIKHNLCLGAMQFNGTTARCYYCEDVDRERETKLARLEQALSAAVARETVLSTAIRRTVDVLSQDVEWVGIVHMLEAALNKPVARETLAEVQRLKEGK